MFHEHAVMLFEKAKSRLTRLEGIHKNDSFKYLLDIHESVLIAADYFQKAKVLTKAHECYHLACLIALQIEKPDSFYLNLTIQQVKQLMLYTKDFHASFILARAYGLNEVSDWIGPIYEQAIEAGNYEYFTEFAANVIYSDQLFYDIIKKWKSNPNQNSNSKNVVENLLAFSQYPLDYNTKYSLALEIGQPAKGIVTSIEKNFKWLRKK